jgi:U3 small nucleolar RNA-associated protein 22
MFIHPEEDYDFVVKLQPAVLRRYFQNVTANPSIWADMHARDLSADGEVPLRPGFDPAEAYLDDLTVFKGAFSVAVLMAHQIE